MKLARKLKRWVAQDEVLDLEHAVGALRLVVEGKDAELKKLIEEREKELAICAHDVGLEFEERVAPLLESIKVFAQRVQGGILDAQNFMPVAMEANRFADWLGRK